MQELDGEKVSYSYEPFRISYRDKKNKKRNYIPDFYLPEHNLIIEVKSKFFYEKDKEVIKLKELAVRREKYDYKLLLDFEIKEVGVFLKNHS